jgi:hypothetical protein
LLPILNHGESAVLYCFVFQFLAGPGRGGLQLTKVREGSNPAPRDQSARLKSTSAKYLYVELSLGWFSDIIFSKPNCKW